MNPRQGKFERQVQSWLRDDYGLAARWSRAAAGIYHNRIPRRFRFIPVMHWTGRNGLAASGPLVALYYGSIGIATAYTAAICLFGANAVVGFLGVAAERKSASDQPQSEALVRFGDLLSAFKTGSVPKTKRGDAIRACLSILEIHARRITKTEKGELSVSLVQYVGSSTEKMTIQFRNHGNRRPVGREFDGTNLLGHHACCAGASPRVVHQLAHFGKNLHSPTQSSVEYKSMFFIPLEVPSTNGGTRVKGFVSIDCRRPYAFYGNRSREIIVTCRPIVEQLTELLRESS